MACALGLLFAGQTITSAHDFARNHQQSVNNILNTLFFGVSSSYMYWRYGISRKGFPPEGAMSDAVLGALKTRSPVIVAMTLESMDTDHTFLILDYLPSLALFLAVNPHDAEDSQGNGIYSLIPRQVLDYYFSAEYFMQDGSRTRMRGPMQRGLISIPPAR